MTLKYLLSEKRLNKPYKGGLSSFGLVVLCAAYLKTYSDQKSVSLAFINLLNFYSKTFNGDTQSITMYKSFPCFTERLIMNSIIENELSIVDSASGRDMTSNCTGFYLIKYQFRRLHASICKIK